EPYVRETAITFETEPPDAAEMRRRIVRYASVHPWLVAESADGAELLGYAYAGPFSERAAYRTSVSVSVYLRQDVRRRGYGHQLYTELLRLLRAEGYHRAFAGITQPNPASMALHQSFGFVPAGLYEEAGFKLGAWRSVAWLQLALSHDHTPPEDRMLRRPPDIAAYHAWRDGPLFDAETRAELAAIDGQPDAVRERFGRPLEFGTAGLRGKMFAGTGGMNRYTVARATQALALHLADSLPGRTPTVVLGHDTRRHSEDFSRIAAQVLAAHGIRILRYPDYIPTPLLAFSVLHFGCDAGVMVTASHNPPAYNGYKVYFSDGTQISEPDAAAVMAILRDDARTGYDRLQYADYPEALQDGRITELGPEPEEAYLAGVRALADRIEPDGGGAAVPLRILYTPLSGTAGRQALRLLREDGFEDVHAVEAQMMPDPDFSTMSTPNPEFRAAFARAEEEALRLGADLVIATDPDGDRFAAMVRDPADGYRHLSGNETGALLTDYVLDRLRASGRLPARPALVKTVVTDNLCAEIARAAGVRVVETLTGFKNICGAAPALEAEGYEYVLGFEESIGYAVGTLVRDKDGLSGLLLLCRAAARLRRGGQTLLDRLESLWDTYGYYAARPLNLVREGPDGQARISAVMAAFRARAPRRIGDARLVRAEDLAAGTVRGFAPDGTEAGPAETLDFPRSDVLRYFFDDGSWYAVRPSGTEPKLKLYLYAVLRPGDSASARTAAGEAALDAMHDAVRPLLEL
ncbi:MAG: GNAT family N-acetyltransferase, partial [Clostridia bacterium]|nr:GNAT family N-acetyltransferase [Clostridia bacterium]